MRRGAALAVAACLWCSQAWTQEAKTGHFVTDDGLTGFDLDWTGPQPLLRFDARTEVLVLTRTDGPDGAVLRLDTGLPLLRERADGALLFLPPPGVQAEPIRRDGEAGPLAPAFIDYATAQATAGALAERMNVVAGFETSIIIYGPGDPGPDPHWTFAADAATNAAAVLRFRGTLGRKRDEPEARERPILTCLDRVDVVLADAPAATWRYRVLTLGIMPPAGFAGRPSTAMVDAALSRGLADQTVCELLPGTMIAGE